MKDLLTSTSLLQLGWIVALSTLIPLGIGVLLDRRFGTAPLFILVGALAGIIGSTVAAVRITGRTIDALGDQPPRPDAENESVPGKEE